MWDIVEKGLCGYILKNWDNSIMGQVLNVKWTGHYQSCWIKITHFHYVEKLEVVSRLLGIEY